MTKKTAQEFLECVRAQLGKPYKWGAAGPDSFDCSGLPFYCFDRAIPRVSYEQAQGGRPGDGSPGDLVFFGNPGKGVSHVGVCVGDGKMIHAPDEGKVVSYQTYLGNSHYQPRIRCFRRYWNEAGSSPVGKDILDLYFYKNNNNDLKSFSDSQLRNHWISNGIKEGRAPCLYYSPTYYVNNNSDLNKAFGNDWTALYNHFMTYGIKELRASSPVYHGQFYRDNNPDLQNLDGEALINHFMAFGINEARQASANFNVNSYKEKNPDLVSVYGNSNKDYFYHYLFHGINEGRPK